MLCYIPVPEDHVRGIANGSSTEHDRWGLLKLRFHLCSGTAKMIHELTGK